MSPRRSIQLAGSGSWSSLLSGLPVRERRRQFLQDGADPDDHLVALDHRRVDLRQRHQFVMGGGEGGDRQGSGGGGEARPVGVSAAVGEDRRHVDEEASVGERPAFEQVVEQLAGGLDGTREVAEE